MKKILMITPFFAPYSHAGVYRAHRFAKYLPRLGWKPYILTVDKTLLYFIDNFLIEDLPKDLEIIRARFLEFTYTGIKSLFKKYNPPTSSDLILKLQEPPRDFIKNIVYKFMMEFVLMPDRYITWYPFAIKKAKELINSENIRAIYSTAPPFTSHLIAMKLKAWSKIPWIADFRDLVIEDERIECRPTGLNYRISCIIEKKVMKEADMVLTTSEGAKERFLSKYRDIVNDKIECIKHGADVEILKDAEPRKENDKFTVIFAGEFQCQYSRFFFELLKVIFERKFFERKKVEVLIVGSIKRNMFLKKEIESLGLSDVVRLVDYISLKDYFSVLLSADATLSPGAFENKMELKLADYLSIKKPIITFETTDEVRGILKESGLGVFIPNGIEDGTRVLLGLLRREHRININEDYINQFTALNQTQQLVDVLSELGRS